jgi:hypothetical protein
MPSPVTALTDVIATQYGTVTLSWTNPGGTTGTVVEGKPDRLSVWTRFYDGAPVTSRVMRPNVGEPWSYRVATGNGASISSWVTTGSITLGGQTSREYPIWLTSCVDPTQSVALGASSNMTSLAWQNVRGSTDIDPMGQKDPITFYWTKATRFAQQMSFIVLKSQVLEDGSVLDGRDLIATLDRFEMDPVPPLLLYRDLDTYERYCTLSNLLPPRDTNVSYVVSFALQQRAVPLVRLTS